MWSLKVSRSSKITPQFLTKLDGVVFAESIWIDRVAGKKRNSLPGWAVGDVLSSMPRCPPGSQRCLQLLLDHLVGIIEWCVISIAMVWETMYLYDGTQWCSVCGEEEGSKNWSLRNPSEQLMCSGFLPSPGHLERLTSEIGSKPAKWNPCDAQWWEGGQEDLMVNSVKSSR